MNAIVRRNWPEQDGQVRIPELRTTSADQGPLRLAHDLALWVATLDPYASATASIRRSEKTSRSSIRIEAWRRFAAVAGLEPEVGRARRPRDWAQPEGRRIVADPTPHLRSAQSCGKSPPRDMASSPSRPRRRVRESTNSLATLSPSRCWRPSDSVATSPGLPRAAGQARRLQAMVPGQAGRPARACA